MAGISIGILARRLGVARVATYQSVIMRPQEAVGIVTTTLATVAVVLLVFTRIRVLKSHLITSDHLSTAAVVLAWIFAASIFPVDNAMDAWVYASPETKNEVFGSLRKWNIVLGLSYTGALCLAKLTILTFYLRIVSFRSLRYTIYILITFVLTYTVLGNFISFLELSPTVGPALLRTTDKPMTILYAACNIFSDLCILLLPLRIIMPLEMSKTMKISTLSLFSAGALVCAAAIWRATTITFNMTDDAHGDLAPFATEMCVTFAECNGAIVCAAVPAMAKFFAQYIAQSVTECVGSLKNTLQSARRPSSSSSSSLAAAAAASAPPPPGPSRHLAHSVYGHRVEKAGGPRTTHNAEVVKLLGPALAPPGAPVGPTGDHEAVATQSITRREEDRVFRD